MGKQQAEWNGKMDMQEMAKNEGFGPHLGLELAVICLKGSFGTCFDKLLELCVDSRKACMHDDACLQQCWHAKRRQWSPHCIGRAKHVKQPSSPLCWCDSNLHENTARRSRS